MKNKCYLHYISNLAGSFFEKEPASLKRKANNIYSASIKMVINR